MLCYSPSLCSKLRLQMLYSAFRSPMNIAGDAHMRSLIRRVSKNTKPDKFLIPEPQTEVESICCTSSCFVAENKHRRSIL